MNPNMLVQYGIEVEIGTSQTNGAWDYVSMNAGWDNLAEALNETITQWFPAADKGFARNHVTGMAPAYTITGKRVLGDAAQEYIFSAKYSLGAARESSLRLSRLNANGVIETATADCTFCNLVEYSGASIDGSAISVELRVNGKPTLSTALGALTVVSVAGAVSGTTNIYVNPALVSGNSYVYKAGATVALPSGGEVCTAPEWTAWNGTDAITATAGNLIAIVEVNGTNQAVNGGIATIISSSTAA
ncbi:MAG: hypothetical protein Q4D04_06220 [Clostridia bacterium]|nr:hypothetical protein [Clostridia bacterium]